MIKRLALAGALAIAAFAGTSCSVNDYCLNCATNDGGGGDAPIDANGDAVDSSPFPDGCIPTSEEICDNNDNDCDGMVDEDAMQVGDPCGAPTPPCSVGVYQCNGGLLQCTGVEPTPEICDDIDNNCNGMTDEGDPGGGNSCGTDVGECVAGIERCQGGSIVCVGSIGTVGGDPEVCDGRDNDCNGLIDDGITAGSCGLTDTGDCQLGVLTCEGGGLVCEGAIYPAFELCDGADQDCDGNNTNGYDLMNDRNNCGGCGNVCDVPNASAVCVAGSCRVGTCDQDFHDVNNDGNTPGGGDGCEYGPCSFQSSQEACNFQDDDCDMNIDEGVTPPPNFCRQVGACAGSTAVCTASGWQCNYGPNVSTDGMGNIVPETTCDGIDNDCDGPVDESHPLKNQPCTDGQQGACTDFGTFSCNPADPTGPLLCSAVDDDGGTGTSETCNAIDDNCDGIVDNGFATGMMAGQNFVTINGVTMMKYEASRPDSNGATQGTQTGYVCSRQGVMPWTNVTRPQAQAACAAIGARLCTETEWQNTCFASPQTFPITGPVGANDRVFIEAEDGTASAAVGGHQWTAFAGIPKFSGLGAMQATPNTGTTVNCSGTQEANAPRIDFSVDVQTTGNYFVWVHTAAPSGSDNSMCAGVDGGSITGTIYNGNDATWVWAVSSSINVATTGVHRFSVYMREDGVPLDAIVISKNGADTPNEHLYSWAYNINPSTPQPNKCNTDPFDTVAGGTDDDDILATGSMPNCFANGPTTNDVFDMTGNIREWTAPRSAGVNAIRGGASNTELNGSSCQNDFVLGSDTFFFPNVGFRCCR